MMIGAIMAGASEEEVLCIQQAAKKIGLAFQIQDDILDVIGEEAQIGKPVNSDEKNHKTTYVTIMGIEKAKEQVEQLSMDAIAMLRGQKYKNEYLEQLVKYLIYREK